MSKPREDYLTWDQYFMQIAIISARRSKDPSTQVGACIVNENNRIVGIGYNGLPNGCSDLDFPWERNGDFLKTKYPFVCHAEPNAILNCERRPEGCRLYCTLFPCNECAKIIIQAGIKEVIYLSNKYAELESTLAALMLFNAAGVKLTQFVE